MTSVAHAVAVDTAYRLALARDVDSYTCAATAPVVEVTGASGSGAGTFGVGLRARNAAARYAWVLIVSSP